MAERTTKVTLSAQVQGYVQGMQEAAKATRATGGEAEKLAQQREAMERMGRAMMAVGTLAAAGVALAVAKWASFDEAMSAVQAATMESEEGMERLSAAALAAGARTVFSAEEAAGAIEELAKAGVSTADILGGALDGALDLAAAGGLGVAEAAGIAATALKTFGLRGTDMAHVADLLAAGAGKAMGDVTDLSMALRQSAMVAHATGLSLEETTGALSAFASQGLLGSDAGTSFKAMLQSLTPTSGAAKRTMDELGISAYDAQGNFVGLAKFAGSLEAGLKTLSVEQQQSALKTIFGSDAIRAATVLYSEGEKGVRNWIDAVDDQGFAAEQARTRLDNLKGDLEALGGALDTALIKTGSAANEKLREMTQWLSDAIDMYNDLPPELQDVTLNVGLLTAGVGLLGGGLSLALPKFVEFWGALNTLGITSRAASDALAGLGRFLTGPWGVALAAAAAVVGVLVSEKQKMVSNSRELAGTLDKETGAVTENSQAWAANQLEQEGVLAMAKRLGIDAKDMTDAWLGNEDAVKRVNAQLNLWVNNADFRMENANWKGWSGDLATVQSTLEGGNKLLEEARAKQARLAEATRESGDAASDTANDVDRQSGALDGLQGSAALTNDELEDLADTIRALGSTELDLREANRRLEASYDDLTATIEKNGYTLDTSTEAGRQVEAAIDDMARATIEAAAATFEQTKNQDEANAKLAEGREKLIDILAPYYETRDAAAAYVDELGLISPEKLTKFIADTQDATNAMESFIDRYSGKTIPVNVAVNNWIGEVVGNGGFYADGGIAAYANGGIESFAGGGFPTGIYRGGPPIHKFAEPETGWEAYISGKPSERDRNREIWARAGSMLGVAPAAAGPTVVSLEGMRVVLDVDGQSITGIMRGVANQTVDAFSPGRVMDQLGVHA